MRIARWVLCLASVLIANTVHSATLAQLIQTARVLALDAGSTTRQRFSNQEITDFLNDAQSDSVAQTQPLQSSRQFQLVPGTTYYPLPDDYLAMARVTIAQLYMQEASPAALDGRSRGWPQASGYPVYYFINWSSPTVVGFTPWPAQASDTATIRMDYFQNAAEMVNATDQPFNGVPKLLNFHQGLAYYAAAMMLTNSGHQSMVQAYLAEYQANMAGLKIRAMQRPNYLPSSSGIP